MKICDVCGKECHHEGRNCTCVEAPVAPSRSAAPPIPERLWCSYPDCHCERENDGKCEAKNVMTEHADNSQVAEIIGPILRKTGIACWKHGRTGMLMLMKKLGETKIQLEQASAAPPSEREAFEKWANGKGISLKKRADGEYVYDSTWIDANGCTCNPKCLSEYARAAAVPAPGTETTSQRVAGIRATIEKLACGEAPDHDHLSDDEYKAIAKECGELSDYLDSIAEGFALASSPEFTALLARCCDELRGNVRAGATAPPKEG